MKQIPVLLLIMLFYDAVLSKPQPFEVNQVVKKKNKIGNPPKEVPSCGVKGVSMDSKIVGGQEAAKGEWPWVVFLDIGCGGTLIKDTVVLTAASCIDGEADKEITIYAGMQKQSQINDTSVQARKATQIITHYGHRDTLSHDKSCYGDVANISSCGGLYDDIALLIVEHPFNLDEYVNIACLPTPDESYAGKELVSAGWGDMGFYDPLKEVGMTVLTDEACQKSTRFEITPYQICAKRSGKGTCLGGDTGGPNFVCGSDGLWSVVGITSLCGYHTEPDIMTRVSKYVQWIEENQQLKNYSVIGHGGRCNYSEECFGSMEYTTCRYDASGVARYCLCPDGYSYTNATCQKKVTQYNESCTSWIECVRADHGSICRAPDGDDYNPGYSGQRFCLCRPEYAFLNGTCNYDGKVTQYNETCNGSIECWQSNDNTVCRAPDGDYDYYDYDSEFNGDKFCLCPFETTFINGTCDYDYELRVGADLKVEKRDGRHFTPFNTPSKE